MTSPLSAFTGTYGGANTSSGINTIYVPTPNGPLLKIHRVREELKFLVQQGLFGVPVNRGEAENITIKPIVYDQYLADNDVPETLNNLTSGAGVLHQEAGMFLINPPSTSPQLPASIQRLGSLPHGVAFNMQGTVTQIAGPPTIPAMNTAQGQIPNDSVPNGIQPFVTGMGLVTAPAASAADSAKFPASVLADPNVLLRNALSGQKITNTVILELDTEQSTMPGGGVTNSAFLMGNAECLRARATFYIETVSGFLSSHTQIQYTQEVLLEIEGVVYPHVTVVTMTRDPLPTPIVFTKDDEK